MLIGGVDLMLVFLSIVLSSVFLFFGKLDLRNFERRIYYSVLFRVLGADRGVVGSEVLSRGFSCFLSYLGFLIVCFLGVYLLMCLFIFV